MIEPKSIELNHLNPVGSVISSVLSSTASDLYVQSLIAPFEIRSDSADLGWRGEFWGKWALGVIDSIPFSPPQETLQLLRDSVAKICQTQEPNGYVGTYQEASRCNGFDLWNIKYTLWALACYADKFDDSVARESVSRLIDYLCSLLPGLGERGFLGLSIEQLQGAGIASMLDPLHFVFTELKLPKAEEIAKQILCELSGELETTAGLGGFLLPHWDDQPAKFWPGAKAYELMATIEGVLKWAVTYADTDLVERMLGRVRGIYDSEIFITGSGSSFELFSSGALRESADMLRPQETCVTVYWMRLCETAWRITADPFFLDQLSRSLHNALLASVAEDASWWSYFCPLKGGSESSHLQFAEIQTSCCVSNGPRGLFSIARWAVLKEQARVVVNCQIPGRYHFGDSDGQAECSISIESVQSQDFEIHINAELNGIEKAALLLPSWSGQGSDGPVRFEEFEGDFTLALTSEPKVLANRFRSDVIAISCGPYVYALDSKSIPESPKYLWKLDTPISAFRDPTGELVLNLEFENRPSHYFNFTNHVLEFRPYFALARKSRAAESHVRYLVWLPQPLVVESFDTFGVLEAKHEAVANLAQDH